jgi:hypothetical protein
LASGVPGLRKLKFQDGFSPEVPAVRKLRLPVTSQGVAPPLVSL